MRNNIIDTCDYEVVPSLSEGEALCEPAIVDYLSMEIGPIA